MEKLIHFLGFFLIVGVVLIGLAGFIRRSQRNAITFTLVWSLALTTIVVYLQSFLPLRFGEQISSLEFGGFVLEGIHDSRSKAEKFLERNCTLIDVSQDLRLIPAPNQIDSGASVAVTDREKLASFLEYLAPDTALFDMVIVDVLFDIPTAHDKPLQAALIDLAKKGKLALAHDEQLCRDVSFYHNDELIGTFGEVGEREQDGLYYKHTLLRRSVKGDRLLSLSLPYRAYTRMNKVERIDRFSGLLGSAREHGPHVDRFIRTWFNPILLGGTLPESEGLLKRLGHELGFGSDTYSLSHQHELQALRGLNAATPLGRCTNEIMEDEGAPFLRAMLKKRMEESGPHVIVIGNFLDGERDVHQTAHGAMHGSAIVIGVLHELLEGGHRASWGFLLVVWACLAGITWALLKQCKTNSDQRSVSHPAPRRRMLATIGHLLFVEEKHYWFLFLAFVLVEILFLRIVNLLSLVLVFAIMEVVFRAMLQPISSSDQVSTSNKSTP
ncbi:MAG: hypothetical protein IPK70_14755 [Flavobacteriales bacterium]|nr:hypothetical protein [Flavobacteriales bacterium]